jgi:hypothetical protein
VIESYRRVRIRTPRGALRFGLILVVGALGVIAADGGCLPKNPGYSDAGAFVEDDDLGHAGGDLGDLAPRPGRDLSFSPPDLVGADFAGFCEGTAVAGTCVQSFFAALPYCFQPAGICHEQIPVVAGSTTWCWKDGAELRQSLAAASATRTFVMGAAVCFSETTPTGGQSSFLAGGMTLLLDTTTGAFKCPGGTTGSIGANLGGCTALRDLLEPATVACIKGLCPF